MNNLLSIDPDERPSTGEILAYPSLQAYLSEYMITENVRENTLMNTHEVIFHLKSSNITYDVYYILEIYYDITVIFFNR